MAGILIMTFLAGLGIEVHPGEALRRGACAGSVKKGIQERLPGILAVAGVLAVVAAVLLSLPSSVRSHDLVRIPAWLVAAATLTCAGWHRIATSSRLDLRRERLERGRTDPGTSDVRRLGWHLFWWSAAPGVVLAALTISFVALPLTWLVYAVAAGSWCAAVGLGMRRGGEKVFATQPYRILHSLGGLALVAAAGILIVLALRTSSLEETVTEGILRPLLGAAE